MLEKKKDFSKQESNLDFKDFDLESFLGREKFYQMKEGHFGVIPAVKILEIARSLNEENNFSFVKYTPSSKPIKINENKTYKFLDTKQNLTFGEENNFCNIEFSNLKEINFEDYSLTEDEKNECIKNFALKSFPEKLFFHKNFWNLSSENIKFYAREVSGEHKSNYGFFNLDLKKDVIKSHLNENNLLPYEVLIEIASQQIAATLIEEGNSPVFSEIEIYISNSNHFKNNISLEERINCEFRLEKIGRDVNLNLIFKIEDNIIFISKSKSIVLPNKILERMIK